MASIAISQDDLSSFHAAHFSTSSINHFSGQFLGPVEEEYQEQEEEYYEDDGLGYYEDGTKRTLTDEQIAIFRHSEIEALLRERRHAGEQRVYIADYQTAKAPAKDNLETQCSMLEDFEDGELDDKGSSAPPPPSRPGKRMSKKEKKIQKAKQMGFYKQHVKPDLRKRTWDKVDTGLGSLSYDDEDGTSKACLTKPAQRRQISYDD
ncbi:uncharacterized protein L3040_007604 [Drepanopeziza brunnea f. sp. 'multigermtubi']|uniref:Uncharacterized protein n=1 Tax=Marssonina brunnea f. sp. multigermtubi (strain MB_m1) TaxID=1072389 RepID=K1WZ30_MARBU|nr:uncharacterized protein MBM_03998 [Drepanopeziza brunnea f. sp. 'multigermtubi' MB_m1]EKD18226.1 hypothetical protein MBM_03998 [Drepanopeziza brunnea f. sp. 'multigermtubi' MB_m1]KAJ5037429.1 hypothetical protein L3040_007604 [Drepanopeziza brunnea f. sp. 'multigermtubi']